MRIEPQNLAPLSDGAEPRTSPSNSSVDTPSSAGGISQKDPLTIDFLLSQATLAANSGLLDSPDEQSVNGGLSDLRDMLE